MPKNCDVRRQVKGLNTRAAKWSQLQVKAASQSLYPQGLLPLRGPLGTKLGFKLSEWLAMQSWKNVEIAEKVDEDGQVAVQLFQVIYVYVYIYTLSIYI